MASPILMGRIASGVKAFLGTHAALTITSLAYGVYGSFSEKETPRREAAFDAYHYKFVTDLVCDMYSGNGISGRNPDHIELGETVTFEDPAAICSGRKEVQEAFRALGIVDPESLERPVCIDVEPKGDSISLTYALKQRYLGSLEVASLLEVDVHLGPIPNNPESKFVVTRIEEQWNGVKPLGSLLFW
eukprot:CAMPEP_0117081014 /NCGR_PEP_ID=MMETSP0472-20121206/57132_1 /TAXON_ID=693140 ORGANISM="Tiarina fusus, Strain LIS" /NCGR_SAMPLE_ID=MMETSP0472 /ASSEMBLY_ACC=CAM_ASM_000603 /LENGTH=187 /DNA_ID=CAMNT_0004808835 /DNA_START=70 /DNA_END=630 /DNA_ORIENTATION=+